MQIMAKQNGLAEPERTDDKVNIEEEHADHNQTNLPDIILNRTTVRAFIVSFLSILIILPNRGVQVTIFTQSTYMTFEAILGIILVCRIQISDAIGLKIFTF